MPMAVATASLLLWYPAKHLYSYHSAIGNIPRALDGVFGGVALFVTVLLAIYLAKQLVAREVPRAAMAGIGVVVSFFVLALSWIVLHYSLGSGVRAGSEPLVYYSRTLLSYTFLFLVGLYAAPVRAKKWWILLFFAIVVNTLLHIRWERWMIDLTQVIDPQSRGMYLGLSTTAMTTGLIAWSVSRHAWLRVMILLALAACLFLMGSRANFAGFLMVFPLALAFTLTIGGQVVFYSIFLVGGLISFLLMGGLEAVEGSRQLQLFELSEASSWVVRNEALTQGVQQIIQSPVIGYYAGQFEGPHSSIGFYIHNLLSVWQAFGVLPFLIYLGLVVWGVGIAFLWFLRHGYRASREAQLTAVMAALVAVLVFAAKSFGWAHVALVWGLIVGFFLRRRSIQHFKEVSTDLDMSNAHG